MSDQPPVTHVANVTPEPPLKPPGGGGGGGGPSSFPNPQPGAPACTSGHTLPVAKIGGPPVDATGNFLNEGNVPVYWDSATFHPDNAALWSADLSKIVGALKAGGTAIYKVTFKPPAK